MPKLSPQGFRPLKIPNIQKNLKNVSKGGIELGLTLNAK